MKRALHAALWLALAAPGLWQLGLLIWAVVGRFAYPYDLEWMEGGVLHGALRVEEGDGMYPAPSIDFIPFLYTPLYPGLVALLGSVVGISYQLGRAISVVSLIGIGALVVCQAIAVAPRARGPALAGAGLALGLFAAGYPFVEGWYDLVRADTLFLCMVTGGVYAISRWAGSGRDVWAHARVGAAGAILGLSFFAKQTGVMYVLAVGPIILVYNWRRAPALIAAAGFVGLGGTALLERSTGGWFWTYIRELHQLHDWNIDRFWRSFDLILTRFTVATTLIAIGLVVVAVCAVVRRRLPAPARALLLWTYLYAVSTLVGAIGWGTEFAHFNAFMPALLHGAIAAGLVVPTVAACLAELLGAETPGAASWKPVVTIGAAATCALLLGGQLLGAGWNPRAFIPTSRDHRAGDELIATLRALPGEVWVPSHPWYAHLAGKRPYVHRMGIKDVTALRLPPDSLAALVMPRYRVDARAIEPALRAQWFAAIVLDNRDIHLESGMIAAHYRPDDLVPQNARPRLYTGARVVPDSIWVPAGPARPPPGVRVLFDFEHEPFEHWTVLGAAWGNGPERKELSGQGLVRRFGGRWFATSFHGGDAATGTMISPPFVVQGERITMRVGGGADTSKLRVELRIDGKAVRTASPPLPSSERFSDVAWDVSALRGQTAALALVDDESGPWGHLNVDEVWLWP